MLAKDPFRVLTSSDRGVLLLVPIEERKPLDCIKAQHLFELPKGLLNAKIVARSAKGPDCEHGDSLDAWTGGLHAPVRHDFESSHATGRATQAHVTTECYQAV